MSDTVTAVSPFKRNSDIDVLLTIVKPRPLIGLGNILILTQTPTPSASAGENSTPNKATKVAGLLMSKTDAESGAVYKEYANADAVEEDYEKDANVAKKAHTYFAQKNASDRVAVLSYPAGKLDVALKNFWYNNWTFAIFADNIFNDDVTNASNIFEVNKDHFLVLQSKNVADYESIVGQDYTIGLVHDTKEAMDAAFIGAIASKTVGSVTWKFAELEEITPDDLTVSERATIDTAHAISYISINGRGQTTEGWTLSGEYIDNLHGDIWIKSNIEAELQNLLQTNDKISYDATGISLVASVVTRVLQTAWEHGIILTDETTGKGDYTVTTTPRSAQSISDISKRHYAGLSFRYHRAGAIHTVTVNGTIQSDTITA
ncbi:hypothetical protein J2Z60_001070 [Lactobacillus colini]|uniref:DUF3383 family protein n=1 Tax=Lactobacillus colini TaxID=1819254 RepID=A0ABS4MDY7_9LACO|nr:DUF3383 family protein [Lactobacillus colini]MBP2057895.1 hypothetical protein [Lactobacillus colini]